MINKKGKSLMETTGGKKWKEHNHLCVVVKEFPRLCSTKWKREPTFKNVQDFYLAMGQKEDNLHWNSH